MAAKRASSDQPDDPKSVRASWRGTQRATATAARYSWQQSPDDVRKREVSRKNLRRRLKLAGSAVVLVALLGAFIAYLFLRAPATPLLAVALTRYAAPLPPNAWADEDVKRMEALAALAPMPGWTDGRGPLEVASTQSQWDSKEAALDEIDAWLKKVRPGGPSKDVALIYLSAHGVVDAEGRACLVLAEPEFADRQAAASGDNPRWLPVRELVEHLDQSRPEVKKLLILDANRMDANWSIGLLYNGFAEALADAVGDASSVAILNSAGAGEIGWAGPELQGSAFGFFVCQSLAGDPRADANRNGRISLKELAAFVRDRTAAWASRNRFDLQSPTLVPADADFNLVWAAPADAPTIAAPAAEEVKHTLQAAEPTLTALGKLWDEHAKRRQPGDANGSPAWREHCLLWGDFERGLVRCEQLALAGAAYRSDAEDSLGRLQELSRKLAERGAEELPVHSLSLAKIWRTKPERADAWRKSLLAYLDDPSKPTPPDARSNYLVRAEAAWSWLTAGDKAAAISKLTPAKIRQALELAGRAEGEQRAELAELHYLRMLAGDANAPGGSNLPEAVWRETASGVLAALEARAAAEQAAALVDERAQYAAAALIASGDDSLRRAEDALFVGRPSDLARAETFRQAAKESFQRARAKVELTTTAYAVRDRAYALAPYLAEWFARRPSSKATAGEDERREVMLQSVLRTIGRAHELDALLTRQLDRSQQTGAAASAAELAELEAQLEAVAKQLAGNLDGLASATNQAAQQVLEQQTSDERTLRDIEPLLRSPLVSGALRRQLRERYADELLARSSSEAEPSDAAADDKSVKSEQRETAEEQSGYLEQLAAWPEHPALAILRRKAAAETSGTEEHRDESAWKRLARQGGEVRRLLAEALHPSASQAPTSEQESASPLVAARAALGDSDRRLRAAAALASGSLPADEDPTLRLLKFDRNQYLAWQAQRRLDDFWGSGGAAGDPAASYFAAAFEDDRDAARKLKPPGPDRWQTLTAAFEARQQAAQSSVFPPPTSDEPRLRRRTLEKTIALKLPAELPPGTAALSVEDALDRPAEIRDKAAAGEEFAARAPIAASAQASAFQFDALIRCAPTGDDGSVEMPADKPWKVNWLYRGHRKTDEFRVRPIGKGIELVYRRRPPEPATVIVEGEGSKEASVAFVLDCSGSMGEIIAGEQTTTRMTKARSALVQIIEELAATESYRVGLWLYGHRRGRNKTGAEVWNAAWGQEDKSLLLGDDVQQVVPLGLLGKQSKNELLSLLGDSNKVQAWGQTPLYLAIVEALENYRQQPVRGPRRLVVITDGKDDQPFDKSRKFTTREEVRKAVLADRRAHPGSPVRIQVLDCAPTERSNLRDLIKDELGGDYIPVTAWGELERKLQDALGLAEYEVAPADAASGAATVDERVGLPATVKDAFGPGRKFRYQVRLVGRSAAVESPIELEGGEAIKLLLARNSGAEQLLHERYDRGGQTELETAVSPHTLNPAAQPGAVDENFNPAEFYIAAHRPEIRSGGQNGKTVAFPLSIQNGDPRRFSPRPAEAWVEITPVFAGGQAAGGPYPICDLSFEPQRPVPVLDCVVPEWPVAAKAAELRVWLKLARTRPALEQTIAELETEPGQLRPLRLPGSANAELGLQTEETPDGCRLTIDEEHPVEQAAVEWLRLETLAPADEIRRTYNYEGRFARHEFLFRGKTRPQIRGDKLQIVTRRELQAGAVAVEKPLRVAIPD